MFMQTHGNQILFKQKQGQNVYSMRICSSDERYDSEAKTCVSCPQFYYSLGLQQTTCSSCQDNFDRLSSPSTMTFEAAVYSQYCSDYVIFREEDELYCSIGKKNGQCVLEENCLNGNTDDGSCLLPECLYGVEEDQTCTPKPVPVCDFGLNEDGETCKSDPSLSCEYGANEDGTCKDKPVVVQPDPVPEPPKVCANGFNPDGTCIEKDDSDGSDSSLPLPALIGIIIGGLILVLLIICCIFGCCKDKEEDEPKQGANKDNSVKGNKSIKVG
jgi:hypothetical protein